LGLSASIKTKSKGRHTLGPQVRQGVERRPDMQLNAVGQTCTNKVAARDLGVARLQFQRHQMPIGGQRAG